jgi:hypothetical protein
VAAVAGGDFFAHPGARLSFTAERAFARTLALVAGTSRDATRRSIGRSCVRSTARRARGDTFTRRRSRSARSRRAKSLKDTVRTLFETERPRCAAPVERRRGAAGAGQSEFIRGACWLAPIREWTRVGRVFVAQDFSREVFRGLCLAAGARLKPCATFPPPAQDYSLALHLVARRHIMLLLIGALTIGLILGSSRSRVLSFRIFEFPDITATDRSRSAPRSPPCCS